MKLDCRIGTTLLFVILAGLVHADEAPKHANRMFAASFFPPLATDGTDHAVISAPFSFNFVGGILGELRGVEIGGVFNAEKDKSSGSQFAGGSNVSRNSFTGVQFSGGANVAGEDLTGMQFTAGANVVGQNMRFGQFAGGANIVGHDAHGAQLAGGVNVTGNRLEGVQISGGVNIAGGDAYGAQFTGGLNVAGGYSHLAQVGSVNIATSLNGAQVGIVDVTGRMDGLQFGTVTIADEMTGFKLGLVNVAGRLDGDAVGLVTIAGNGITAFTLWFDEAAPVNVGVKLGSQHIYNLFALGIRPGSDATRWLAGIGLGGHVPFDPLFVDLDGVDYKVSRVGYSDWSNLNNLARVRFTVGWQATRSLAITLGASLNLLATTDFGNAIGPADGYRFPDVQIGTTWLRSWPGYALGIQLKPGDRP